MPTVISGTSAAWAVSFDGSTAWWAKTGNLGSIADGKIVLFSCWFRLAATGTGNQHMVFSSGPAAGTNARFTFELNASDRVRFVARDSTPTAILDVLGPTVTDTHYHQVALSIDLANVANRQMLFDGAIVTTPTIAWNTYDTNNKTIDLSLTTSPAAAVGALPDGSAKFAGDLAELYFHTPATYFDLAILANSRKFILSGSPMNLGLDGSTPTTTIPFVCLNRKTTPAWGTNAGSGGNFSANGALGDGTRPVELTATAAPPTIVGAVTALSSGTTAGSHSYGYTVPAGSNGLIVIRCGDSVSIAALSTTWTATGASAQPMTALTLYENSSTNICIFYLANPSFGTAGGVGTISTTISPNAVESLLAFGISGWDGQAPAATGGASGVATTDPAARSLTLSAGRSYLVIHAIVTSLGVGLSISWDAAETEDYDGTFGGTVLTAGLSHKTLTNAPSSTTVDAAFSASSSRYAEAVAGFAAP